jgi:hypothetical protein
MSRVAVLFGALAAALRAATTSGAEIPRAAAALLHQRHDVPKAGTDRRAFTRFQRVASRASKTHFIKRDAAGATWRACRLPHSAPMVVAVYHEGGRRRYKQFRSRADVTGAPAVLEHVNGFGQVTKRERLDSTAGTPQ